MCDISAVLSDELAGVASPLNVLAGRSVVFYLCLLQDVWGERGGDEQHRDAQRVADPPDVLRFYQGVVAPRATVPSSAEGVEDGVVSAVCCRFYGLLPKRCPERA